MLRGGFLLFALLVACPALAFEFPGGQIEIPDDFDGPISDTVGDDTQVFAFRKQNGEGLPDAQLQITTWKPSRALPELQGEELEAVTQSYLLQFFGGLQRTRDEVRGQTPDFIDISGARTARMNWEGEVSGTPVRGRFYALIHDSKVVLLHSQDMAESEKDHFERIVDALESTELTDPDSSD